MKKTQKQTPAHEIAAIKRRLLRMGASSFYTHDCLDRGHQRWHVCVTRRNWNYAAYGSTELAAWRALMKDVEVK
jgi:hypothetical protein